MAKVIGIGGVFYKAQDPQAVRDWYARVLGFELTPWGGVKFVPPPENAQAWSLFAADTDHFAPSEHPFMINLAVDDIDGVLARAADAGVEPLAREDGDFGRFAWLMDPTGVKLELWQAAKR
ncbi:MAG TPA: VOC family protein [Phenylobacterium sp.]|nr:VOC family protein [Phenylobacterium sp.]